MPRNRKRFESIGDALDNYMGDKVSSRELARRLTAEGVPSDRFKVMRWRRTKQPGRGIEEDAAQALDRIFQTVHVFEQFAYDPRVPTVTRRLLDPAIQEALADKDRKIDELQRRIEKLEKGA